MFLEIPVLFKNVAVAQKLGCFIGKDSKVLA